MILLRDVMLVTVLSMDNASNLISAASVFSQVVITDVFSAENTGCMSTTAAHYMRFSHLG